MAGRKKIYTVLLITIFIVISAFVNSSAAEYEKVPILMVHGLYGSSSAWVELTQYLKQNGYSDKLLYTIDITVDNNTLCSTEHVPLISNKVEQIVSNSGFSLVDVIGHSRGGLNLYNYMRVDNGVNRVRNWISLAGANNACPTLYNNTSGDLTPGNQTLYTSIYSLDDTNVNPKIAIIQGARNIELQGFSHKDMRTSTSVFPYVLDSLQGNGLNDGLATPSAPTPPTNLKVIRGN